MPSPEVQQLQQAIENFKPTLTKDTDAKHAGIALIRKLFGMVGQHADNPAAIRALVDLVNTQNTDLSTSADSLMAEVLAGTPADPEA